MAWKPGAETANFSRLLAEIESQYRTSLEEKHGMAQEIQRLSGVWPAHIASGPAVSASDDSDGEATASQKLRQSLKMVHVTSHCSVDDPDERERVDDHERERNNQGFSDHIPTKTNGNSYTLRSSLKKLNDETMVDVNGQLKCAKSMSSEFTAVPASVMDSNMALSDDSYPMLEISEADFNIDRGSCEAETPMQAMGSMITNADHVPRPDDDHVPRYLMREQMMRNNVVSIDEPDDLDDSADGLPFDPVSSMATQQGQAFSAMAGGYAGFRAHKAFGFQDGPADFKSIEARPRDDAKAAARRDDDAFASVEHKPLGRIPDVDRTFRNHRTSHGGPQDSGLGKFDYLDPQMAPLTPHLTKKLGKTEEEHESVPRRHARDDSFPQRCIISIDDYDESNEIGEIPVPAPRIRRRSTSSAIGSKAFLKKSASSCSLMSTSSHLSEFASEVLVRGSCQSATGGMRGSLHLMIEEPDMSTWRAVGRSLFVQFLILCSVLVIFFQSMEPAPFDIDTLRVIDLGLNAIFIIEVTARLIVYPNRRTLFTEFSSSSVFFFVDLFAAIPLWLPVTLGYMELEENGSFGVKRFTLICLVPELRLMKMLRYMPNIHLLMHATLLLYEAIPSMLFVMLIIMWTFASLLLLFEPPENIHSLPHALWMAVVTVTTVGYGDVAPVTGGGYVVSSGLIIIGLLYIAMPLGIVGNIFTSVWRDRDRILLMKTTRRRLAQWGFSAHDIPDIFAKFDVNGTGELDVFAFNEMLNTMDIGFDEERCTALFQEFDSDRSGSIDASEFLRHLFPKVYIELYASFGSQGKEEVDDDAVGETSDGEASSKSS